MANDCLVKRLKGTVNNSNLDYFGAVMYHIKQLDSPAAAAHKLAIVDPTKIQIFGEGSVTVGQNVYTKNDGLVEINSAGNIVFSNDNFDVAIYNRYTVGNVSTSTVQGEKTPCILRGYEIDASGYNYADGLYIFDMNGVTLTGRFSNFKSLQFFIPINNAGDTGDYGTARLSVDSKDLMDYNSLQAFSYGYKNETQYNSSESNVVLNVVHFAKHTGLYQLYVPFTGASGEIADMAAGMVANGRTSGTLSIQGIRTGMTVEGTPFNENSLMEKFGTDHPVYMINVTFGSSYPNGYTITAV